MSTDGISEGAEPDEEFEPEEGVTGDYRSDDDVRAGLDVLAPSDIARIVPILRSRARGTELSAKDLLNTAVERLLDGRRHWRKDESLLQCLLRTARSLVMDWWRRSARVSIKTETSLGAGDAAAMEQAASLAPNIERELLARAELAAMKAVLQDDKKTYEVVEFLAEGEKPAEIRAALGINQTEYDSALKRIVRARNRARAAGEAR